jgi:hypothetical protein
MTTSSLTTSSSTGNGKEAWKGMLLPLIMFLVAMYFWESTFVLPIKYLTVFFHELSHGLAAIFTGGSIDRIELSSNQGGVCWTRGGIRLIVVSAGYLGSLIWGAAILIFAVTSKHDRKAVAGLGFLLLAVTLLWVRNLFGVGLCIGTGLALLAMAKYATDFVCDQFLKFLGLTSCFYVLLDIKSDLIDRSISCSDASKLAEMLVGTTSLGWVVGGVWLLIAGFITWKALVFSFNHQS